METIGSYLKTAREKQQKTLGDIAKTTCISKTTLEAIEADRTEFMPPNSYLRGFVKLYAQELGLPEDEALALYERQTRQGAKWEPQRELKSAPKKIPPAEYIIIIGIGLLLCGWLYYMLYVSVPVGQTSAPPPASLVVREPLQAPQPPPPEPQEEAAEVLPDAMEPEQAPEQSVPEPEVVEEAAVEPAASERFMVKFVARQLVWIRLQADDSEAFEIMLHADEYYRKSALQRLEVRLGNPAAVDVFFNDAPVSLDGAPGTPLNVTFPAAADNR